jgi:hypothetical protein
MGRYDNWGVLDDILLNLAPFSPLFSAVSFLPCLPFLPSHLFTSLSSFLLPLLLTPLFSLFSSVLLPPLFSFFPPSPLQSQDTVHDTQWLFPRDRVRGRGRAYADENPPDSSPSFDGVQRVWKKSDPATTGIYGPRSLVNT